ncbi:TPA: hypothetical protein N0F65_001508 [Lagenidium giganteum]|uniref:Ubiquitin-like protease family profile domain-containing protein n=1 Tax=Lagenidium giganteum TaxID=4803 RepID=A0AAV2YZ13_9STRA|nr:TPA: hypothetical protein N0F65_001508 [Lagenidium giganteum]
MDVHVCRPRKTESDEAFTPRAAYMAMACELNDDSLRKFYNPAGKDQSKRYVVIFAKDKRAEEFATVESLLKTEIYDPVQLIKKSQRLDFLRALRLEQSPPDVEGTGARLMLSMLCSAEENASSKKEKVTDTQLTYPLPPCSSDIVTITTQDVARLQPERYFNDNLIDYYFKRIMLEDFKAQPRIQKNVLFLSSHFYSQLRLGKGSTPIDRVKAGYKNVSTWLARSDFFNRSMVFIPINKEYAGVR